MLNKVRIILVNPSHPGNIGATARAMKNMGFAELYLVNPQKFPDPVATVRASGAEDLLDQARVVSSIKEATEGCHYLLGTSARSRKLEKPMLFPKAAAKEIVTHRSRKTAILFGRESIGLTNPELALCHAHIVIPTVDSFSSLNLSQAVQILCYALRCESLETEVVTTEKRELASSEKVLSFYEHLERTLIDVKFLHPRQPKRLMQRLQRLFNRAELDTTELDILRGILSRVDQLVNSKNAESG